MYCQYCGNELKKRDRFCPSCGASVSENANTYSNSFEYDSEDKSSNKHTSNSQNNSSSFKGLDSLAFVAYFTWIGFLIAFLLYKDEQHNEFVDFHLNQALILNIAAIISGIPIVGWIIGLGTFVLWIMAIINVIQKKMDPLPIIGNIHIIS